MDILLEQLKKDFGNWGKIYTLNKFILDIRTQLSNNGFLKNNSRLIFSVCSDDINRLEERKTIESSLKREYNGEFHLGGLAAYPISGITGLIAASHHAPNNIINSKNTNGNLIIFLSPHLGLINKNNENAYGKVIRPGQNKLTSCCGAIMGFLAQLKQIRDINKLQINFAEDNLDITKSIIYNGFINNFEKELKDILIIKEDNKQIIEIFKLNFELVKNKIDQILEMFLNRDNRDFEGKIALITGLTVNLISEDVFILKDLTFMQ